MTAPTDCPPRDRVKTARLPAARPRLRGALVLAAIAAGALLLTRLDEVAPRPLAIEEIRDPSGSAAWILTDPNAGIFARPRVVVSRAPGRIDPRGTTVRGDSTVRIIPPDAFVYVDRDGTVHRAERPLPAPTIARLRAARGRAPVAEWLADPDVRASLPALDRER